MGRLVSGSGGFATKGGRGESAEERRKAAAAKKLAQLKHLLAPKPKKVDGLGGVKMPFSTGRVIGADTPLPFSSADLDGIRYLLQRSTSPPQADSMI